MKKMLIFILSINIACLYGSDSDYGHGPIDQKSFQDQAVPLIKDIGELLGPLVHDDSGRCYPMDKKHKILLDVFREAKIGDDHLYNIISIITRSNDSFIERADFLYKDKIDLYCLKSMRHLLKSIDEKECIDKKEKEYLLKAENILSSMQLNLRRLNLADNDLFFTRDKFSLLRQKLLEENKFDPVVIEVVSLLAYPEFYCNLKLLALSLYNSSISLKYLDYIVEKLENLENLKPSRCDTLYISAFEEQLCLDRELKRLLHLNRESKKLSYLYKQEDDYFILNMVALYIDIKSWENSENKKRRIIDFLTPKNLFKKGLLREEEVNKLIEVGIVSDELESLNNGMLETVEVRAFFYSLKSFFDRNRIKNNDDITNTLDFLVKNLPWENKERKVMMISNCLMQILSGNPNWYAIIKAAYSIELKFNDLVGLISTLKLIN